VPAVKGSQTERLRHHLLCTRHLLAVGGINMQLMPLASSATALQQQQQQQQQKLSYNDNSDSDGHRHFTWITQSLCARSRPSDA